MREEFIYLPSENIYYTKLKALSEGAYANRDTENHKGEWRNLFVDRDPASAQQRKLHVELGCNGGHVALEWAERNPSDAYIGIDVKYKQVYKAFEKAQRRGIKNTLFLRAQSERIDLMFAPQEIDFLYLYFPDPWAKKSQLKNRIVQPEWLIKCASVVKDGGIFHIKTDHAEYADWMRAQFQKVTGFWKVTEDKDDLHAGHPNPTSLRIPEVTLFERIFIKEGIKIHSFKLEKLTART